MSPPGHLRSYIEASLLEPFVPFFSFAATSEVWRRARRMVCLVNAASVDRIIYSIFHKFSLEWRDRTL